MYKKIIIFIFMILCLGFIYNIYGNFFIGGDIQPFFYDYDLVFDSIYMRIGSNLLGGVASPGGNILVMPSLMIVMLSNMFSQQGEFVYLAMFILSIFGCYSFFSYLYPKEKNINLTFILFFTLSLAYHYLFTRGVLFTQFITVLFFWVARWMLQYLEGGKDKYLLYAMLISLFWGLIASNPGYFVPVIVLLVVISYRYGSKMKLSIRLYLKRIILYLFFLCITASISVFSFLLFAKYNTSIVEDAWNTEILMKGPLESQKTTSVLSQTLRGWNGDMRAGRGYKNSQDNIGYHPFPGYVAYQIPVREVISWLPIGLIILGFFIVEQKYKKSYLFWVLIFLINLFFYKSAAAPFGKFFERAINNVGFFGIFRNPHQKLGLIFVVSQLFVLYYVIISIKKEKRKNITLVSLLVYSVMMGYFRFIGNAIPKINLIKTIPSAYKESAQYINQNESIKRIALLPYNESTRTNTEFGYEGYTFFAYLLPKKQMRNRNDIAFSSYNKLFMDNVGPVVKSLSGNLLLQMQKLNIDTIIYDGYTDRYPRFHYKENHENTLSFLSGQGLSLESTFGKITIWRLGSKQRRSMVFLDLTDTWFSKINPTKYSLNLTIPANSSGEELRFLQSFHDEWKLYPGRPITTGDCTSTVQYSGGQDQPDVSPTTIISHIVGPRETLRSIITDYGYDYSEIKALNPYLAANPGAGTTVTLTVPGSGEIMTGDVMSWGPTSECMRDGYTFFQGEELSYLWRQSLRDDTHHMVYDYANSRSIDLSTGAMDSSLRSEGQTMLDQGLRDGWIISNPDGSYNVSLTLYFRPQSWFYLGLLISGLTLVMLMSWLLWDWRRRALQNKSHSI